MFSTSSKANFINPHIIVVCNLVCRISILKTMWEKEKWLVTSYFSFPTVFSSRVENFMSFSSNLELSSANSFSLEESKICLLLKGFQVIANGKGQDCTAHDFVRLSSLILDIDCLLPIHYTKLWTLPVHYTKLWTLPVHYTKLWTLPVHFTRLWTLPVHFTRLWTLQVHYTKLWTLLVHFTILFTAGTLY